MGLENYELNPIFVFFAKVIWYGVLAYAFYIITIPLFGGNREYATYVGFFFFCLFVLAEFFIHGRIKRYIKTLLGIIYFLFFLSFAILGIMTFLRTEGGEGRAFMVISFLLPAAFFFWRAWVNIGKYSNIAYNIKRFFRKLSKR